MKALISSPVINWSRGGSLVRVGLDVWAQALGLGR